MPQKIVAAGVRRPYSPEMQSEPPAGAANPFSGEGTNRNFYLPRLNREFYQGDAVVHWTLTPRMMLIPRPGPLTS